MKRFLLAILLSWAVFAEEPTAKTPPEPVLTAEAKLLIRDAQLKLQVAFTNWKLAEAEFKVALAKTAPAGYDVQDDGLGDSSHIVLVKKEDGKK